MQMNATECMTRLTCVPFGVLGTVDSDRGTHLVPVVFVVGDSELAIPVDRVKPKTTKRLRRLANLRADPRATLLVDRRGSDWDQLWWVSVELGFAGSIESTESAAVWRSSLATKYPQYGHSETIDSILVFTIASLRGWKAT